MTFPQRSCDHSNTIWGESMKKLFAIFALVLGASAAHAAPYDWRAELEEYKLTLEVEPYPGLWTRHLYHVSMAGLTCSASAAMTGASFIAETFPVGNVLSEVLANFTDPSYQTYEALVSWDTLLHSGRGALGGGVVGMAETLEFLTLWLGGNTDEAFSNTKENYKSTLAIAETVFASQGQCMMQMAKEMLVMAEMSRRDVEGIKKP